MSKTLVLVLTHPGASEILERNWPWILKCGCDVGVVYHEDEKPAYHFPESKFNLELGLSPDKMKHRWLSRFLLLLEWFAAKGLDYDYRSLAIIEGDCIFVRALPSHPGGMVATLAGHRSEGFLGEHYWHCPWILSHRCTEKFLRWSMLMLACGMDEHGFIDRFVGLVQSLYPLQITPASFYSRNTILPEHYAEARTALERGACGAHGVKTEECLRAITEGL